MSIPNNRIGAKIRRFGLLLGLAIICTASTQTLNNAVRHQTPNMLRPGYLQAFEDPTFGHTVIRITDAGQAVYNPTGDRSLEGRMWGMEAGHGYSSRTAWNADQSLMLISKGASPSIFLDGETYEPLFSRRLPGNGRRWHPTDPEILYYVDKSRRCVGGYNPLTETKLWDHCFSGYDKVTWSDPGKGKPSLDGSIIPLRAKRSRDGHWVAFLYFVESGDVSDEIDMSLYVETGDRPDYTLSPLGDTIIINGCVIGHKGRCQAQVAIDVSTKQELWRVLDYHAPGHADEAVDKTGRQWRIGVSKAGKFKGHVIKRDFRTGEAVSLIPYWGSHVSTRNINGSPGKAIVSFHSPSGPYRKEIVGVCLDGSCVERYAHTHRFNDERYLVESQGSVSPNGDKVVFRTNWGEANGPIDAYVIELGARSEGN